MSTRISGVSSSRSASRRVAGEPRNPFRAPRERDLKSAGYASSAERRRLPPVDITAFWRPALQGCHSRHHPPLAHRALPAIPVGLVGEVGQCQGQLTGNLNPRVRLAEDELPAVTLQNLQPAEVSA